MPVKRFDRGTSVRIEAEFRDADGDLLDPGTYYKVTLTDPDGTVQVSAQAMTKDSEGKYYYDWQSETTDPVGSYDVVIEGKDLGIETLLHDSAFFVLEST